MAASPGQSFAEEIDYTEIELLGIVGRGSFGVVSKANWRDKVVAVKRIETEAEISAFRVEVLQLSRVDHPNIVKLYGACTKKPVCLVMEYAEGGSLYNVLHCPQPQPIYTASHAMSWALQCSRGVAYLHAMKPKALIHRDLKPANLLLVAGGTILKICDFGTACDIQTYMTNNKGSAAWMAPEVFEGSNYSEKCDVFSWAIILWEVIARRKPFDDIGGPAFRIMWAVHNGTRPPLIKKLPKPIEILMTRCWAREPAQRPSMEEVLKIMSNLFQYFKGADQPIIYPEVEDDDNPVDLRPLTLNDTTTDFDQSRTADTVQTVQTMPGGSGAPRAQPRPASFPCHTEVDRRSALVRDRARGRDPSKRHSADLLELTSASNQAELVAASSSVQTHRRSNSQGYVPPEAYAQGPPATPTTTASAATSVNALPQQTHPASGQGSTMPHAQSYPAALSQYTHLASAAAATSIAGSAPSSAKTVPENLGRSVPWDHAPSTASNNLSGGEPIPEVYMTLDHQLQPLPPSQTSSESMRIYEEHCKLAQEFLRVQTERALLNQRKKELAKELDEDYLIADQQGTNNIREEYSKLSDEQKSLLMLRNNYKEQLDKMRSVKLKSQSINL